jgi:predicted urease superfamily metal-dependent hydrolase
LDDVLRKVVNEAVIHFKGNVTQAAKALKVSRSTITNKARVELTSRRPGHPKYTHCINGHRFTEETEYIDPKGRRTCRLCKMKASRLYKRALRKKIKSQKEAAAKIHKYQGWE